MEDTKSGIPSRSGLSDLLPKNRAIENESLPDDREEDILAPFSGGKTIDFFPKQGYRHER